MGDNNSGGGNGGGNSGGGGGGRRKFDGLPAFIVEVGDDTNRQIQLSTIRMTLRGSWSAATLHSRGEDRAGRDLGVMAKMPDVPGLRMLVEPAERRLTVFDPLEENPQLLDRINRIRDEASVIGPRTGSGRWTFVKKAVHDDLSDDTLKTLILEIGRLVVSKSAKVVKGEIPSPADLRQFVGRELFDPGSNSSSKPRYTDEVEQWRHEMNRRGV